MSTSTAEIIEQHAARDGVAVYYSKSHNLRLIRRAKIVEESALGRQRTLQDSLVYSFAPEGSLVVREGQDVLDDGPNGELQDVIAWLDAHPRLNDTFAREGAEPDRALPLERDFLAEVNQALVGRDATAIRDLLITEQGSHGRTVLVDAAVSALQALRDAGVDIEPEPGEELEVGELPRDEVVRRLYALGLEVPVDATDSQLRAALLLATTPAGETGS